jgi:type III secretory pathway component EscT
MSAMVPESVRLLLGFFMLGLGFGCGAALSFWAIAAAHDWVDNWRQDR